MEVVIKRALFIIVASAVAALTASAYTAEAVTVRMAEDGLVVLTSAKPSAGLASVHVSVNAGSSFEEERLGSGLAHLVEHMLFKGTRTRGPGTVEKEAKSYGALLNGSVNTDTADYYITVPKENLRQALSLLKDILSNALFDGAEMQKEAEVIAREIGYGRDDPEKRLIRSLYETAYLSHPYRYPVIGYEDGLRSLARDDLVRFYERTYVPANMVVAVAGDIDEQDAASAVIDEFKDFGRNNRNRPALVSEPRQICERRSTVRMPLELAYMAIAFHTTRLMDPDLFACDVLAMILGRGDDSRLSRALVKRTALAHSVSAWNHTPRDPGLFVVSSVLEEGNAEKARGAILREIAAVKEGLVTDEELTSAKRMALADHIFSTQTSSGLAESLATGYLMAGTADFSDRYVKGISSVTKEDVRTAANRYLREDGLTQALVLPAGDGPKGTVMEPAPAADIPIRKEVLPNGLRLLFRPDSSKQTVSLTAAIAGGVAVEDEKNNGISHMVSRMLLKGTSSRTEDRIVGSIERLGGRIEPFSGFNSFGINIEVLKEDLQEAISILGDVLTGPVFPEKEFDLERSLALASIIQDEDDIFSHGSDVLREELFRGSAYALRHIGRAPSVSDLKRSDLAAFYGRYGVTGNTVISICGDIDADGLLPRIEAIFKSMRVGPSALRPGKSVEPLDGIRVRPVEMDRSQSLVMFGFRSADIGNRDRYAMDVLASVLSGHSGRMFDRLRARSALAYALGCVNRPMLDAGYMLFYAATTKEGIPLAERSLLDEINLVRKADIGREELDSSKKELCLARKEARQTNAFFSMETAVQELYGLGADNVYNYEKEVGAVTSEDVKRCAGLYLDPASYCEVTITPKD